MFWSLKTSHTCWCPSFVLSLSPNTSRMGIQLPHLAPSYGYTEDKEPGRRYEQRAKFTVGVWIAVLSGNICMCEELEVLCWLKSCLCLCLRPAGSSKLKGRWVLLTSAHLLTCCLGLPGRGAITHRCLTETDTCHPYLSWWQDDRLPVYRPLSSLEPSH